MVLLRHWPAEPADCPLLGSETTAYLNDVPLATRSLGGLDSGGDEGTGCIHPSFALTNLSALPPVDVPSVSFRLVDRSTAGSVTVTNPFRPRGFAIVEPPSSDLPVGQGVALEWSVPTDLLGSFPGVEFTYQGGKVAFDLEPIPSEAGPIVDPATQAGLRTAFVVPAVAVGAGTLTLNIDDLAATSGCSGPHACVAGGVGSAGVSTSILP